MAGFALPQLADFLRPWLPELIGLLLFVSALRIGPTKALGGLRELQRSLAVALVFQLIAPFAALALLTLMGASNSLFGIVLVLLLAAPSVTGAPNFAIMMNRDPTAAMRLLLVGTAIFPLTVVPVLFALPAIPTIGGVVESATRLFLVITAAVGLAFLLRGRRTISKEKSMALDGFAALLLAIVVVGLMSALGPALRDTPAEMAIWLAFALAVNFGLQAAAYMLLPVADNDRTGMSVVAGNRNIALFLVALPSDLIEQILLFIGCYQIPMYLTPILMRRFLYRDR